MELDFKEADFVDCFFFSPSFLTLASTAVEVGSDVCKQGAKEQAEGGVACCGKEAGDGAMDATAGAAANGGPEVGSGTVDVTQFGSAAASLLGRRTGCAVVVPFSRTSQLFADCNVFGIAADTWVATSAAWGTEGRSANGMVCGTVSFPCALSMSHSDA